MLIKDAFYLRQMPTQIAIVLTDDRVMHTSITPFRQIDASELHPLIAMQNPVVRKNMLTDRVPEYILRFYGLEKEKYGEKD